MTGLTITRVPVSSLVLDEGNVRRHGARDLRVTNASLDAFEQVLPLLVQKGTLRVIDGNGRLTLLRQKGVQDVDVVLLDVDDVKARAIQIAVNRSAELATWDMDTLERALEELDTAGYDRELLLGFTDDDLEALLPDEGDLPLDVIVEDDVPDPPKDPQTKPGDVWTFPTGHRVVCGDSLQPETYAALLQGKRPDMAFTDPPYNTGMTGERKVTKGTRLAKPGKKGAWLTTFFDDDFTPEQWDALLDGFTAHLAANLAEDSVAYVCLDWRRSHELVPRLKRHFEFSNLIVWDKMVHGLGSDYKYTHEFIHVARKGAPTLRTHQGDRELSDVWHVQRVIGRDEDHATKKPLELPARAIRHATRKGGTVLDPFLGSGSTLIAAEQTGRVCYGIELQPAYVDVVLRRYVNLTGQRPVNQRGEEYAAE